MKEISRNQYIAVIAGVAVIALFFFIGTGALTSRNPANQTGTVSMAETQDQGAASTSQTGLIIQDSIVGTGALAAPGKIVSVNYTGTLQSGTKFDASADHGGPFQFQLGAGQVISGWEQGIAGMKVGGKRVLIIPPSLAYGNQQVGPIPANSTLIFTVELVGVADKGASN